MENNSVDDKDLSAAVDEYLDNKNSKDYFEQRMNELKEEIVDRLHNMQMKTVTIDTLNYSDQVVTVVGAETLSYDVDKFKEAVGDRWEDFTIAKIDQKKVRQAVLSGELDPHIVADCSVIKKNKPYIKITKQKVEDLEDQESIQKKQQQKETS